MIKCPRCKKPTTIIKQDFGIGPYEYWGSKGVDSNIHYVTSCCEECYGSCCYEGRNNAEEGGAFPREDEE